MWVVRMQLDKDVIESNVTAEGFVSKDGNWHHYAKVGDKEYVDGKEFEGANSFMPLYHKPTKYVVACRDTFFGVSTLNMWTNSKKKAKQFAKHHKGAVIYKSLRKFK